MAKPLIIIAPGSFSPATEYASLLPHLEGSGYETYAYNLPTASKKPGITTSGNPIQASTLAEDGQYFRGILTALCDQSQNVVILGHSYGGMVISEAVQGLTQKRVGKGRVLGMIYLTAAAIKEGQSLGEVTADAGFDFIKMDGDFMYMDPIESSAKTNFSDLPLEKAVEHAKRFVYHSAPSFGNTLQYAGYKDADNVAYIFCTEDKTLGPDFQQSCINNINAARKENGRGEAKVYKLETSHCPHASAPVELARRIVSAIGDFEK